MDVFFKRNQENGTTSKGEVEENAAIPSESVIVLEEGRAWASSPLPMERPQTQRHSDFFCSSNPELRSINLSKCIGENMGLRDLDDEEEEDHFLPEGPLSTERKGIPNEMTFESIMQIAEANECTKEFDLPTKSAKEELRLKLFSFWNLGRKFYLGFLKFGLKEQSWFARDIIVKTKFEEQANSSNPDSVCFMCLSTLFDFMSQENRLQEEETILKMFLNLMFLFKKESK